jgi:crotonobetainyl-CoA:carnitine CoA-transferase CaiB-like acyl-CoA transferase
MAHNAGRIEHEDEIDEALGLWCAAHASTHIINTLEEVRVPVGPIYSVEDMMTDPQYQARGMFESVEIDGKPLKIPAIMPRLEGTPGRTDWPGQAVGSHNDEVLRGLLQLDDGRIEQLKKDGVIG